MRKRFLIAGSGLVVVVLGLSLFWLWPDDRIHPASCERIHEGMTLAEVEAILGGPAGVYTRDGKDWSMGMLGNGVSRINDERLVWVGNSGGIRVDFDEEGQVHVTQGVPRQQNFWNRMRSWLSL
jgi:hypothetical protein